MIRMKPVDVVIVGFGWTGAIMGMELVDTGLKILALERGAYRDTSPDFTYPHNADELAYGIRGELFQPLARDAALVTVTDGHPATLSWLGAVRGQRIAALGVDHFGQSGDIADLYAEYGIDANAIVEAAEAALNRR